MLFSKRCSSPLEKRKLFERTCQIWGWILFIVSAFFFIWASIRVKDIVGLLGGLFFLVACLVFLIPFVISDSSN